MKLVLVSYLLILYAVFLTCCSSRLDELKTVQDYMDICLVGMNHKQKPGPESHLFQQCRPWTERSCCTQEVAEGLQLTPRWLNFDWDHCKELSPSCREFFIQDLCFYECTPNAGPWLVEDVRKIRKERFMHVPLCPSVCNNWWEACKNDFTCVRNWAAEFNWSSGINTCPKGNSCRPFHELYSGAKDFCEKLMNHSFEVAPQEEDCFYLWFDPDGPNPNEKIARKAAASKLGLPYHVIQEGGGNNGCEKLNFSLMSVLVPFLLFHVGLEL